MKKGLAKNEIAKILIGAVWVVLGVIVFFIPDILEASYHVSYLPFEQSPNGAIYIALIILAKTIAVIGMFLFWYLGLKYIVYAIKK